MLDCIIIGAGPAGISAALTLKANGKTFALVGSLQLSSKIYKADEIRNYPGLSRVKGIDFQKALQAQLAEEEISIIEQKATGVYEMNGKYVVTLDGGEMLESKAIILSCGVENIKEIEGEQQFLGRGVSYCATCDGFLYKGKTIAILCTSKSLEHEIDYLAKIAEKVYLIPMYKNVEISGENIVKILKMPKKIIGDKKVAGIFFEKAPIENLPQELAVDGIFMLKECVSPTALVAGLQTKDGHVVVERNGATSLKGCFAAGDCTGRPYQYAKAIGEGNVAAHSVIEYCK